MWFKRKQVNSKVQAVDLTALNAQIDRLAVLIDQFDDLRKQVSRIERKVYRSNGHEPDEPVPAGDIDNWYKDLR